MEDKYYDELVKLRSERAEELVEEAEKYFDDKKERYA